MPDGAPLKYIDIQNMLGNGVRGAQNALPPSLAFMLGSQIPPAASTGIDPRRLPFNDVSPQLRDQRQLSLANPPQQNPFSVFGAIDQLNRNSNTLR